MRILFIVFWHFLLIERKEKWDQKTRLQICPPINMSGTCVQKYHYSRLRLQHSLRFKFTKLASSNQVEHSCHLLTSWLSLIGSSQVVFLGLLCQFLLRSMTNSPGSLSLSTCISLYRWGIWVFSSCCSSSSLLLWEWSCLVTWVSNK